MSQISKVHPVALSTLPSIWMQGGFGEMASSEADGLISARSGPPAFDPTMPLAT